LEVGRKRSKVYVYTALTRCIDQCRISISPESPSRPGQDQGTHPDYMMLTLSQELVQRVIDICPKLFDLPNAKKDSLNMTNSPHFLSVPRERRDLFLHSKTVATRHSEVSSPKERLISVSSSILVLHTSANGNLEILSTSSCGDHRR